MTDPAYGSSSPDKSASRLGRVLNLREVAYVLSCAASVCLPLQRSIVNVERRITCVTRFPGEMNTYT
jgi:hypothetical protein